MPLGVHQTGLVGQIQQGQSIVRALGHADDVRPQGLLSMAQAHASHHAQHFQAAGGLRLLHHAGIRHGTLVQGLAQQFRAFLGGALGEVLHAQQVACHPAVQL